MVRLDEEGGHPLRCGTSCKSCREPQPYRFHESATMLGWTFCLQISRAPGSNPSPILILATPIRHIGFPKCILEVLSLICHQWLIGVSRCCLHLPQEATQHWVTALPGCCVTSSMQAVTHAPWQLEITPSTPPRAAQHSAQLKLCCLFCKSATFSN